MGAMEIFDYVDVATPDYNGTLTLNAQGTIKEYGIYNQVVHLADDNTEEVISIASSPMYFIDIPWRNMTEADAGTVWDFWASSSKANGRARTFQYTHSYGNTITGVTSHVYVVRFDCDISRDINMPKLFDMSVKLKIKGRVSEGASPSISPSESPSASPSISPSASPSLSPSESPSASPSISPSESPSLSPSESASPSISPSLSPSASPSVSPSESPSASPSA